jgi:hypothetical protein
MPRPEPRRRAAAVIVLAAALGFAGCGGGGDDTTTTVATHRAAPSGGGSGGISSQEKRAATRRLQRKLGVSKKKVAGLKKGRGLAATSIRPAQIVPGGPGPFFSTDTIYPVTNGWEASDHRTYTGVDAGANPADPSIGELGIFRQDHIRVTQSQKIVDVPGAGAVRIVRAPTGRAVATSAQSSGNLEFVGRLGVRGVLHLSDDTVTITHRGSPS